MIENQSPLLDIVEVAKCFSVVSTNNYLDMGWVLLETFTQAEGHKDYSEVFIVGRSRAVKPIPHVYHTPEPMYTAKDPARIEAEYFKHEPSSQTEQ